MFSRNIKKYTQNNSGKIIPTRGEIEEISTDCSGKVGNGWRKKVVRDSR